MGNGSGAGLFITDFFSDVERRERDDAIVGTGNARKKTALGTEAHVDGRFSSPAFGVDSKTERQFASVNRGRRCVPVAELGVGLEVEDLRFGGDGAIGQSGRVSDARKPSCVWRSRVSGRRARGAFRNSRASMLFAVL